MRHRHYCDCFMPVIKKSTTHNSREFSVASVRRVPLKNLGLEVRVAPKLHPLSHQESGHRTPRCECAKRRARSKWLGNVSSLKSLQVSDTHTLKAGYYITIAIKTHFLQTCFKAQKYSAWNYNLCLICFFFKGFSS